MTGKQRYSAMLRGEAVDFVPRIPILMQFAADHIAASAGIEPRCSKLKVDMLSWAGAAEPLGKTSDQYLQFILAKYRPGRILFRKPA